jgi:type VI protein secretion system component VasA
VPEEEEEIIETNIFFKKKSQAQTDLAYGKWDLTKSPIINLFIIVVP